MARSIVTWSVEGNRGTVNRLMRMSDEMYADLRRVVLSAADRILREGRAAAPVGKREYYYRKRKIAPGYLKKSIRIRKRRKNKSGGYSKKSSGLIAEVGSSVGYARYVEFGTRVHGRKLPGQPYMYPAAKRTSPWFHSKTEKVLQKAVKKYG